MKRNRLIQITAILSASAICVSCASDQNKTIKIAVMGDHSRFYPDYEEGLVRAVEDMNSEYSDNGYRFEYTFYDDEGRYEKGAKIIDDIAGDDSVTAVIGSTDMRINKTAAYVCNDNSRLFVLPYTLYDSVYEENNYNTVLSLASSGNDLGAALAMAATKETALKRWAVCAAGDEFSMSEMRGFHQINDRLKDIRIVDCNDIVTMMSDFESEIRRWKSLKVDGIALFPGTVYAPEDIFGLLKRIRSEMPNALCIGDGRFDYSGKIESEPEFIAAMDGFIIVPDFTVIDSSEEEKTVFEEMREAYKKEHGYKFDLWYLQGYNMLRMIGDTAVKHNTADSAKLAAFLHEEGYNGIRQRFQFKKNGSQAAAPEKYYVMNSDGTGNERSLK